jgi:hypothetical protein
MPTPTAPAPRQPGRIPFWVKVSYTAFVGVLVPYYWAAYGPTNFLYFCDVALVMTLAAVWAESPLLASMPAIGILLPQVVRAGMEAGPYPICCFLSWHRPLAGEDPPPRGRCHKKQAKQA